MQNSRKKGATVYALESKMESGYGTDFYPFRFERETTGAYGPFSERNGKNWDYINSIH